MATTIFPTVNDVNGGVAGAGRTISEASLASLLAGLINQNYVQSGLTGGTSANLTLTIASGGAVVSGYRTVESAAKTLVLGASVTLDVYYQLTRDGSNHVTGSQLMSQTSGLGAPVDSVLLGTAVTSGSAITAWTDHRPLVGYITSTPPTWSAIGGLGASGFTLGNGALSGRAVVYGKMCWFRIDLTIGSTTSGITIGTIYSITGLPATANANGPDVFGSSNFSAAGFAVVSPSQIITWGIQRNTTILKWNSSVSAPPAGSVYSWAGAYETT